MVVFDCMDHCAGIIVQTPQTINSFDNGQPAPAHPDCKIQTPSRLILPAGIEREEFLREEETVRSSLEARVARSCCMQRKGQLEAEYCLS